MVGVNCLPGLLNPDIDVMMLFEWSDDTAFAGYDFCCFFLYFCGSYSLLDVPHVALLGLVGLREVFEHSLGREVGPRVVVPGSDGLEPCCLGWKSCTTMEVADDFFCGREFVDIVDGFLGLLGQEDIL